MKWPNSRKAKKSAFVKQIGVTQRFCSSAWTFKRFCIKTFWSFLLELIDWHENVSLVLYISNAMAMINLFWMQLCLIICLLSWSKRKKRMRVRRKMTQRGRNHQDPGQTIATTTVRYGRHKRPSQSSLLLNIGYCKTIWSDYCISCFQSPKFVLNSVLAAVMSWQRRRVGVEGLIHIENPNRVTQKAKKVSQIELDEPRQLSRRERCVNGTRSQQSLPFFQS